MDSPLCSSSTAVRFSMKQKHYEEGNFSSQGRGLGTVTEEMVRKRAGELALINGRAEDQVLDSDLAQARRELTEDTRQESDEDKISEDERWDPVPGGQANPALKVPAPDEQTFAEKLVREGRRDAEHERMVQATRESLRRDQEE